MWPHETCSPSRSWLRGFLEITRAELIRYFTLTSGDESFVGRFLGRGNVLGASVQLCTLPWLSTDHLREVLRYAGWRRVGTPEWKQLDEFLIARALEHDSPKVLLGSVCEYLLSERVVRPGAVLLLEHVAAAPVPRHVRANTGQVQTLTP